MIMIFESSAPDFRWTDSQSGRIRGNVLFKLSAARRCVEQGCFRLLRGGIPTIRRWHLHWSRFCQAGTIDPSAAAKRFAARFAIDQDRGYGKARENDFACNSTGYDLEKAPLQFSVAKDRKEMVQPCESLRWVPILRRIFRPWPGGVLIPQSRRIRILKAIARSRCRCYRSGDSLYRLREERLERAQKESGEQLCNSHRSEKRATDCQRAANLPIATSPEKARKIPWKRFSRHPRLTRCRLLSGLQLGT